MSLHYYFLIVDRRLCGLAFKFLYSAFKFVNASVQSADSGKDFIESFKGLREAVFECLNSVFEGTFLDFFGLVNGLLNGDFDFGLLGFLGDLLPDFGNLAFGNDDYPVFLCVLSVLCGNEFGVLTVGLLDENLYTHCEFLFVEDKFTLVGAYPRSFKEHSA